MLSEVTAQGIIPARAGFTPTRSTSSPAPWDHPRSRGVYFRTSILLASIIGSSPLARGLPALGPVQRRFGRIIPARAGFTLAGVTVEKVSEDHPRSRGVYQNAGLVIGDGEGSSPLARGLPKRKSGLYAAGRIIPARAGFTPTAPLRNRWKADHPRSRGVYLSRRPRQNRRKGSSPLARGLRGVQVAGDGLQRIIPARAGFTLLIVVMHRWGKDHPRSRGVYPSARRVRMRA